MATDSIVHLDQGNRWSSLKHLDKVVQAAISTRCSKDVGELEVLIRKFKPDFLSLLKNPARSALHREVVVQSVKDGITVVQQSSKSKRILPKNVVEEALLMSEMFELNELAALELIITGDSQVPRYPGAARGPVAVLLYYDAKRSLLLSLKSLLQAVSGNSWSINLSRDFNRLLVSFFKELINEGVVEKALENLSLFDVQTEFDLLHRNRALGPGKFKKQVYDLIKEIEDLYSYIVFAFAAQFDLKTETVNRLLKSVAETSALDSNGCFDSTTVMLVIGVFYSLDCSRRNVANCSGTGNDGSRLSNTEKLPQIFKDKQALSGIFQTICSHNFSLPQVKTLINYALGLTLRNFKSSDRGLEAIVAPIDEEKLIDDCISEKVFDILDTMLIKNAIVESDEFIMSRLHCLLIDLPHLFPLKVKELRDRGDEEGRIVTSNIHEGINPPASLNHHFQKYLQLLANYYTKDRKGLSSNFWKSPESLNHSNVGENNHSFSKFFKSTLETYLPQNLRLELFNLLAAFAKASPFTIFTLLRSSGNLHNPQFSFGEIFKSFDMYYKSFSQELQTIAGTSLSCNVLDIHQQQSSSLIVTATDVEVFCAILKMIEAIVSSDKTSSIAIAENQSYNCIPLLIGLVTCPISRRLKACLLTCLGGFCKSSSSVALNVWDQLDVIIPKPRVAVTVNFSTSISQRNWTDGVYIEVEDIEPRNEEYPVTIGYLKCLSNVVGHVISIRDSTKQSALENSVNFMVNAILLKVQSRVFAVEYEKWTILSLCLNILNQVLKIYQPMVDDTVLRPPFMVINQILQENLLFRTIMCIIENVTGLLHTDTSPQVTRTPHVEKDMNQMYEECLLSSLQVFGHVIEKQNDFMSLVRSIPGYPYAALMPLSTLFANVNPRTNEADRLATLIKICSLSSPSIRMETIKMLRGLVSDEPSISHLCLLQVQPFKKFHDEYILHGFVDALESGDENLRLEVLKLLAECFQSDCKNGSLLYGLAHKLLGLDRKMQLRTPGSLDQTYTCLHSIISAVDNEPESSSEEERYWRMKILLLMSTNPATRFNTLRFLRTSYELIANYLKYRSKLGVQESNALLPEIPLFWELLATELKTVVDSSLKSYSNCYIRLLLGSDGDKKFLDLIPSNVFTHSYPEMPSWEYFDSKELWNTISSCSEGSVVDIKSLHQRILFEVKQFSSQLGASQAGNIQSEIKSILAFACNLNASKRELDLKLSYCEGWRDLVETILLTNSLDVYDERSNGVLVLQLLNELLAVPTTETITSLMNPLSSIITTATTTVRKMPSHTISKSNLLTTTQYLVNVLESPSTTETWNQLKRSRVNLYTSLLHLLRALDNSREHKLSHRLLDKLVKDSLSGVELVKVLALSILAECDTSWVSELAADGSLRMMIDTLSVDDKEIKASQCDKLSKAFYSFEAKVSLLVAIASSQAGARTLIHLGIVDCLLTLETFEIYANSTNRNEVCFKVFASVLKLVLLLVDMSIPSDQEILARFLTSKSHMFYDLMRSPSETYRRSNEGKIIIHLLLSLTSKLILFTDCQLQKSFIHYIQECSELRSSTDPEIVTIVLQGCIRFMIQNPVTPLFLPSWDFKNACTAFGQPSLGLLIPVLENSVTHLKQLAMDSNPSNTDAKDDNLFKIIIESGLYVIWHHLNLFSNTLELSDEESLIINQFLENFPGVLNDMLFGAIRSVVKDDTFVDATIRRINRIICLRANS